MKLAYTMRRRRTSVRMTRWILLISFAFLFARLIFATLGAWHHQQEQRDNIVEPIGQMQKIAVGDRGND